MASKIKVDQIETVDGTGNITVNQPLSGSGAGLTSLPAANITGTLPAISGASLTGITAGNITGVIPAANLGTGTASASTFLNGSGAYAEAGGGAWEVLQSTNITSNTSEVILTGMSSAANTSAYNTCFFTVTDALPTSAGAALCLRFGAIVTGSTYGGANDYGYHCSKVSDEDTAYSSRTHATRSHIAMSLGVNTGTDRVHCVGWIGGHYNNNQIYAHGSYVCDTTAAAFKGGTWHGSKHGDLNRTWNRIGILFDTGSVAAGRFTLYGLKNS